MQLVTLGGLRLAGADFVRAKPLLLLVYLALEGPRDRRHLAELFWLASADPLNSLAAALKQLRQGAAGLVEADKRQVWTAVRCDAAAFLQAVEANRVEEALALYGGPFLSGVYLPGWSVELEEWVYGTREFLAGRMREVLLHLGETAAANGEYATASKRAEAAYLLQGAAEPEPEELKRLFILLAAGESAQLAKVRKEAQGFDIELGLSLKEAREWLRQRPDNLLSARHTLPSRTSSFVGRNVELLEAVGALSKPHCSLLTLTGTGGVGKSRLALHIAQHLGGRYRDGVFFVSLEALTSSSAIPFSIAATLAVKLQGGEDPLEQVAYFIGAKTTLLVLDNFEHLLAGTELVSHLLKRCLNLNLLITSRERLNVEEEWVLPVEGLAVPAHKDVPLTEARQYDSLQLFLERAKRARLSFELTPEELPYAISICQSVQGLPLGIELAAAWVKVLACRDIAQEIEEEDLDFLESPSRDASFRHKSVRAVLDGSWQLLSTKEKKVLKQLSVFQGGFDRKAAGAVAGATLSLLASLVDKSLLRITPSGRYDRHPLLYKYCQEKLAEDEKEMEVRHKHAAYFLALAEKAEPEIRGAQQAVWLERLAVEHDNFRAALQWTQQDQETQTNLCLAGALSRFWWLRGHLDEGRTWLKEALTLTGKTPTTARAKALDGAGLIAWSQSDYGAARLLQMESLEIYRALKDRNGMAVSLNNLGIVAHDQCDYALARSLHEEGLALQRELGNERGVALTLTNLGLAAHSQGDYTTARTLQEESLALFQKLRYKEGIALSLLNLALVVHDQGNLALAHTLHEESLRLRWELGSKRSIAFSLEGFAGLAVAQGESERAARLWGAAEGLRDMIGAPLPPSEHVRYARVIEVARSQLNEIVFNAAWAEGRAMTLQEAVAFAINGSEGSKQP